jgi:anti-anti-sigma factor
MTQVAQPLLISAEKIPSGTLLRVRGEVDLATATQLRDAMLPHLAAARNLWLDLEGVTFMDSSGLHVLVASQGQAALHGTRLVIAGASPAVDRLFQITGTTALFARAGDAVPASSTVASVASSKTRTVGSRVRPSADLQAPPNHEDVTEHTADFATHAD